MNVRFFPVKFLPNDEQKMFLAKLQERLELAHAELAFQVKGLSEFQQRLAKERYHHEFRHRLKVLSGGKVESKEKALAI